jgi:hypothetical protein
MVGQGHGFKHDGCFGLLGSVVETAHADVARLGIIGKGGGLTFTELATTYNWHDDDVVMNLLKSAADELGYKLVKKSTKKDNDPLPKKG